MRLITLGDCIVNVDEIESITKDPKPNVEQGRYSDGYYVVRMKSGKEHSAYIIAARLEEYLEQKVNERDRKELDRKRKYNCHCH